MYALSTALQITYTFYKISGFTAATIHQHTYIAI